MRNILPRFIPKEDCAADEEILLLDLKERNQCRERSGFSLPVENGIPFVREEMSMRFLDQRILYFSVFITLGFFIFSNCSRSSQRLVGQSYDEGFSLKQPQNWQARVKDKKVIWISAKTEKDSPFLFVYPFFLKNKTPSSSWLQKQMSTLTEHFSGIEWDKMKQIRSLPDEAAARFRFKKEGISYQGLALCSIHEKSGILYVIAAPLESFELHRSQLMAMLESFRFEEPKQDNDQSMKRPKVRYTNWQDPRERAFNLEVPQGWSVEGGTFRRASVDVIHVLRAGSPDGKIVIQFNDSTIPVFVLPSPILSMGGFVEGSWYSPG